MVKTAQTILSPQQVTVQIKSIERLTADVYQLTVQHIDKSPFLFRPGQYAVISIPDSVHDPRPYSIGSVPNLDYICFHIKDVGHGLSHALAHLSPNTHIDVNMPMGHAFYRPSQRPLLLIGGGLGVAPLLPIAKTALQRQTHAGIFLYHGVASSDDLYLHDHLIEIEKTYDSFRYIPVVEKKGSAFKSGRADDAVAADFDDLSGYSAYISGSVSMIEHSVAVLSRCGLQLEEIFSDGLYLKHQQGDR